MPESDGICAAGPDMTAPCGDGLINLRVGAVILKDGKFLMAGNTFNDYLYSVGGRIRFGETAAEAVIREVFEETGVKMEIDRLGFINENYFSGDVPGTFGRLIYEVSFYFYMKVPEHFEPHCSSVSSFGSREYLKWCSADEPMRLYPDFFRKELQHPEQTVKYFLTDERPAAHS